MENSPRPSWFTTLAQHAASVGEDPEVLWNISGAESSYGKNNIASTTSARGPFHITEGTFGDIQKNHPTLGLVDRNDPVQSATAAPYHARAVRTVLSQNLNKPPEAITPTELYVGWWAGIGDGPKILKADPNTPLELVMRPESIQANARGLLDNNVRTTGDFIRLASTKMKDTSYSAVGITVPKVDLSPFLVDKYKDDPNALGKTDVRLKVALGNMLETAPDWVKQGMKIGSAYRSVERQQQLFDEDIAKNGGVPSGMVGRPGKSNHNHGLALDLQYASPEVQQWFHDNAEKHGLHFPYMKAKGWTGPREEPWHIELVNGRAKGSAPVAKAPVEGGVTLSQGPSTPNEYKAQYDLLEEEKNKKAYGIAQGAWEAMKRESAITWMAESVNAKPDPNFNASRFLEEDAQRLKELGVPENMQTSLVWASNRDDYERKLANIRSEMDYEQRLRAMGLTGGILRFGAAVLDPAGIILAAATPALAGGAKASRLTQMLLAGMGGAATNVAIDIPQYMSRPGFEKDQLLYSGLVGFGFGAGIAGLFPRHPALAVETGEAVRAAEAAARSIESKYFNEGSAGAAQNLNYVAPLKLNVEDVLTPEFGEMYGKTAFGSVRVDYAGRGGSSDNPLVRAGTYALVEDAVGRADNAAATKAVTMEMNKLNLEQITWTAKVYSTAWDDYVKKNKIGWAERNAEEARFRAMISDAAEEWDNAKFGQFPAEVQKVANFNREWMGKWFEIIKNPGFIDGTRRKALIEGLEKNDYYLPHLPNMEKFDEIAHRLGDKQMITVIRESILAQIPDLDIKLAKKVANSFYKGMREASTGMDQGMSLRLSGFDKQVLREELERLGEMSKDEIEVFLRKYDYKEKGEGSVRYLKHRTPLKVDHEVSVRMADGSTGTIRVKDWLERDFVKLHHMYSRTMSARVALARMQIENPRWRAGDPEAQRYLLDGIYKESDWQDFLQTVKDAGNQLRMAPDKIDADVNRLQSIYEAITGRMDKFEVGKLGSFLRTIRNFNFMRVMNQVGFAQIPEAWTAVSQVGIKTAVQSIPSFKSFLRDIRTGELKDELAKELEWAASPATDAIRSSVFHNADEMGNVMQARGRLGAAEDLASKGAHITSHISGMQAVNTYLQRWASKMVVAKFANAIDKDVNRALNMKRMAVLGIDEDKAVAILDQMKKHSSFVDGEFSGSKLTRLNWENWDPKVRYDFQYAIYAWTRRMIQENDLGQMNAVFGSSVGKILFQFRMFMFGAWTKQTLHNLHVAGLNPLKSDNHVFENYSMMMGTLFLGALAYSAQVHLQSVGRSDRQKFLEERLGKDGEYKRLAAAAFQRSGWTSLAPLMVDNLVLGPVGMDPLFDTRSTGTPSQGLLSNPTFALIDSAYRGLRGVGKTVTQDSPFSQTDARAITSLAPYSNWLPFVWLNNLAISGLPEKEPPRVK